MMVQLTSEYRDFLLFLPSDAPGLKAVLRYYSSAVTLNAEGDAMFSDDTIQGLGTSLQNFLKPLLGSLINIASPSHGRLIPDGSESRSPQATDVGNNSMADSSAGLDSETSSQSIDRTSTSAQNRQSIVVSQPWEDAEEFEFLEEMDVSVIGKEISLTWLFPDPGYFAAGGVAGVVSRTATAPLDRLKVYLIANTGEVAKSSLIAAKKGDAATAVKHIGQPLIDATKELWKAGGWRSLFAGTCK